MVAGAEKLGRAPSPGSATSDRGAPLVTDTSADPAQVDSLRAQGIDVVLV